MPGALAIWSPLLHALCTAVPALFPTLLGALTDAMNGPAESELRREALCLWAAHVLCDDAWAGVRARRPGVGEEVLMACFSAPEYWNLQLAEKVLDEGDVPGGKTMWGAVLEAAKSEGAEMVVDGGEGVRGEQREEVGDEEEEAIGGEVKSVLVDRAAADDKKGKTKEKVKGPVKVLGLWKPRPIGTLPEGWDEDE
jgi:ribosomal biogenesis protein LAS1